LHWFIIAISRTHRDFRRGRAAQQRDERRKSVVRVMGSSETASMTTLPLAIQPPQDPKEHLGQWQPNLLDWPQGIMRGKTGGSDDNFGNAYSFRQRWPIYMNSKTKGFAMQDLGM